MTLARKVRDVTIAGEFPCGEVHTPDFKTREWVAHEPTYVKHRIKEPLAHPPRKLRWFLDYGNVHNLRLAYVESRLTLGQRLRLPEDAGARPLAYQASNVVRLGKVADTTYVLTRNDYYALEPGVTSADFEAWWADRDARRARTVSRVRQTRVTALSPPQRLTIPKDARLFVWQRDGGKCVECGSNRELEFDHIIPVSMGGSNTARNLQLLCEPCNRAKGGNLV